MYINSIIIISKTWSLFSWTPYKKIFKNEVISKSFQVYVLHSCFQIGPFRLTYSANWMKKGKIIGVLIFIFHLCEGIYILSLWLHSFLCLNRKQFIPCNCIQYIYIHVYQTGLPAKDETVKTTQNSKKWQFEA